MKKDLGNAKAENTEDKDSKDTLKVLDRLKHSPCNPPCLKDNKNHKVKNLSFEQWLSRNYPNVKFKELDCLSQQRIFKSFQKNEKYRQDHKDQIRKYRQDHKDQIAQRGRKYRQDHKDQIRKYRQDYYRKHKKDLRDFKKLSKHSLRTIL